MATLTRRFIIICLVFTIFALLMAAAVANSAHRPQGWHNGAIDACLFRPDYTCAAR
ncbi:hypothetical protein [Hoeflea olei]|uniref:hypothetical protein n=1 Tax=Hoeflea olei TaxID=1480615 RepID=UPI001495543A|nr:hypothetical protein [Hoeflea olei]